MDGSMFFLFIISWAFLAVRLIMLSHKNHKQLKKMQEDLKKINHSLQITLSAMILEIIIMRIGKQIPDKICDNLAQIIEGFPENLLIDEEGVWQKDYENLMNYFITICPEKEIIKQINICNDVLDKTVNVMKSQAGVFATDACINTNTQMNLAIKNIKRFSNHAFLEDCQFFEHFV
ncbi:MAG: hypothetical protein CR972_02110 [Candidatus Moraniibacteriota bacterium]|nr:MAG: hypothetical protein CR972_02110 [Candidatus Moranbacteria bacterium]